MTMQIEREFPDKGLKIKANVASTMEAFLTLAEWDDVLNVTMCGHCGGNDLKYVVRRPKGYLYFSIDCQNPNCRHEFSIGQTNEDNSRLFGKQWVPPYEGDRTQQGNQQHQPQQTQSPAQQTQQQQPQPQYTQPAGGPMNEDDIPF